MRKNAPRLVGFALFWISGGLLLSASSCIVQEPQHVPGQPLTWQEQHALDLKKYQELGDARRRDHPCSMNGCR